MPRARVHSAHVSSRARRSRRRSGPASSASTSRAMASPVAAVADARWLASRALDNNRARKGQARLAALDGAAR